MTAPLVTIVDYGAGNLFNLRMALVALGAGTEVTNDPGTIHRADRLALPGVGAFGAFVTNMRATGAFEAVRERARDGRPFLGVCLGMQVLFDGSAEAPDGAAHVGLGLYAGRAERFDAPKVPHMGWNDVTPAPDARFVQPGCAYFVHSYRVEHAPAGVVPAWCDYAGRFLAGFEHENRLAVQFHPEKSGAYGAALLKRWLAC